MLQLVDERGFEGATIAELARRSGLPASSVYWHFSSKDDILAAALTYSYHEKYADRLPWPETPDARPLVDQLVDALVFLEGDGAESDYIRVGLALCLQRSSSAPAARAAFLEIRQEARRRLGEWWGRVLAQLAGQPCDARAAEAMSRLTLAVLDGRYLTGRDVHLVPENTQVLALLLAGAAHFFAAGGHVPPDQGSAPLAAGNGGPATQGSGREALVAAAIEVLCDHGYSGATVARICERAGLPASSLYWHFDDLSALLAEAVDSAFEGWSVRSRHWSAPTGGNYRTALAELLRSGFARMLQEPAAFRIGYQLLLQRGESEARERFRRIRYEVVLGTAAWFADWLGVEAPEGNAVEVATGPLAGMLAWSVMTVSDGLFVVETVSPLWDPTDASEALAAGLEYVMTQHTAPAEHAAPAES